MSPRGSECFFIVVAVVGFPVEGRVWRFMGLYCWQNVVAIVLSILLLCYALEWLRINTMPSFSSSSNDTIYPR